MKDVDEEEKRAGLESAEAGVSSAEAGSSVCWRSFSLGSSRSGAGLVYFLAAGLPPSSTSASFCSLTTAADGGCVMLNEGKDGTGVG